MPAPVPPEPAPTGRSGGSSADLWGGLAATLVAAPSAVAFGVLVYGGLGPEHAGAGAQAGLLGAAALGLAAPWVGRTGGLISAPCAPAAAVLTAFLAECAARPAGAGPPAEQWPALLGLTMLLAALLQVGFGLAGGGRLIKFMPYPVVTGYLSGVGVLIALAQLPKWLGWPREWSFWDGLVSPGHWRWPGVLVGLATIAATLSAGRWTRRVPATILGLAAGLAVYGALALFDPGMRHLDGNPLVVGPLVLTDSVWSGIGERWTSLTLLDGSTLRLILVPALTLAALLSIDTLKTCVVLDALTHRRHHSDRELIGQGLGNLAAFLAGGISGAGTMGPTLVNVGSGGRSPRAAGLAGLGALLILLCLSRWVGWVPIPALAGLLLVVAGRMFDTSLFRLLRHPTGRQDFAVSAAVILAAVVSDLIVATGVGVLLAILLFIRDQARETVIRRKRHLGQVSSKTRRLADQRELLQRDGGTAVLCELQGNLFFGTADQLLSRLESDLAQARYLLLDLRRVQSLDYTAAHLLESMHARLAERGGALLLCGLPSALLDQRDFANYLAQLGITRPGRGATTWATRDEALEWMEDRLLEAAGHLPPPPERLLSLDQIEILQDLAPPTLTVLAGCLREVRVPAGQTVFTWGSPGGEILFVRRGQIRIFLPLGGGQHHHLATIGPGDFFGGLSFLDHQPRSADAVAQTDTDLFALPRASFDQHCQLQPAVGTVLFARLAAATADLLRRADEELRALEER